MTEAPGAFTAQLLGVRGSTPAPGAAFVRYGGHTSCVALRGAGDAQPTLLLDAGTGVRDLGGLLTAPFRGDLLLSHLHWDHVQGLPFSPALTGGDVVLRVLVPTLPGQSALDALRPGFSPPGFPVPVDELAAGWSFGRIEPAHDLGPWRARTAPIRHKGGPTVGIRVERGGRSLVHLPDHDLAEPDPAALDLVRGADVLLHDAQYRAAEILPFRDFGHSTIERACAFAAEAGVDHLVLTHHAPDRTDDELDGIAEGLSAVSGVRRVTLARQGDVLHV